MPALRSWLLASLAAAAAATAGAATVIIDSEGFEPPRFSPGDLEGQDGWLTAGGAGSASTAEVQSSDVLAGSNALRVERAANSNTYWGKTVSLPPTGRFTTIDWAMKVQPVANPSGFGPFLGVVAFDDTGGRNSPPQFVASLGVDGSTGDILIQQGGTGTFIETGATVSWGAWVRYRIELDFLLDTYTAFADDLLVGQTAFVDDNRREIDLITDVNVAAIEAGADLGSQAASTFAVIDNFVVRDGLRGDYNNDGRVDAADYTFWRDHLGQSGFGLAADGDANGSVGPEDYEVWKTDFARLNTLPPAASATPEPASPLMLAAALVAGLSRARKR